MAYDILMVDDSRTVKAVIARDRNRLRTMFCTITCDERVHRFSTGQMLAQLLPTAIRYGTRAAVERQSLAIAAHAKKL